MTKLEIYHPVQGRGLKIIERGAEFDASKKYRHLLWRTWDQTKPPLIFIMLNPSTADAEIDDATIRVCMGRAMRMGFGGIRVANLFPYRATYPSDLLAADDPLGADADQYLHKAVDIPSPMVIAAWGQWGVLKGYEQPRYQEVVDVLCAKRGLTLHALRTIKNGQPGHPLRIAYSVQPFPWRQQIV